MMRKQRYLWLFGAFVPLLTGCFLLGARPTEIPLIPTDTPVASMGTEVAGGPTTSPATAPAATASATAVPAAQVPTAVPTLPPTAPTQATPAPPPTWPPSTTGQAIVLELPATGQSVGNPLTVRGRARQWPFEGTLVIHVYDALDQLAAEIPIIAEGDLEGPATFEHEIPYGGVPGAGRVEVLEFSAMDGSVVAKATVDVKLLGFPGGGVIESPAPLSEVTLPIKLLARVGRPNQQVKVTVTWDEFTNGGSFEQVFTTLEGLDGQGLLIVPLDVVASGFRHPRTGPAQIEVTTLEGSLLAMQPVRILHPDDPETVAVQVYWARGEALAAQTVRIPRTLGIARAALELLLWGPVPGNQAGYETFIPSPAQILAYPGRDVHWGEQIRIRSLTIRDGIAYADFSLELGAYSGGATHSIMIREQIKSTLRQFSTINDAVITVNGASGILEP
jgi:hypothetical protein